MDYLQELDDHGTIGFSRAINVVDSARIRERAREDPALKLLRLDHVAIEDQFLGKTSEIWYRDRGRWQRLSGMNE